MRKAGAVVVNSMREFKMYPKHHHVIIVSDDEDCDDEYNMKIAGNCVKFHRSQLLFSLSVMTEFNPKYITCSCCRMVTIVRSGLSGVQLDFRGDWEK